MPIAEVFQGQEITIGALTAVYSHFIDAKQMHVVHVDGNKDQCVTVSEDWLQQIPDGCTLPVGAQLKGAGLVPLKTIIEVRYPFYRVEWNNGFNEHNQSEWLRDDKLWQTSNMLGTVHNDPYEIILPDAPKPEKIEQVEEPDIEMALFEEMLSKIEALQAQVEQQSTELTKAQVRNEQLERDLKKAKNNVTPPSEVDAIKAERDSLKAQVVEIDVIRKERDQLRTQLAMFAQEQPKTSESNDFAVLSGATPISMLDDINKRRQQGFAPYHVQVEGGKWHILYQRQQQRSITMNRVPSTAEMPSMESDYVAALTNHSSLPEELSAIGNAAIFEAGAKAWGSK